MNIAIRGTITLIVAGMSSLLLSAPALAQTADTGTSDLVAQRPTVWVTEFSGKESVGRLKRVDPSSLTIDTPDGERSFERRAVYAIHRRGDSVANGARFGVVLGAAAGARLTSQWGCGALLDPYERCPASTFAAVMAMTGGLGAGIGIGIDALFRGRTQIYPPDTGGLWPTVSVVPAASRRHANLSVSMRW